MRKLVILDFNTSTVHIYDVKTTKLIDDEFIEINTNHSINNIQWIVVDDIVRHKGILK